MSNAEPRAAWIPTPAGRLFAARWQPVDATGAPIVLFHDSLGSVAQWRRFPALLAAATGREVIAYDRLGYGRSDRHSGRLELDFIDDEARTGFRQLREALGIGPFIAFGHSIGGGMAVACAAAWPGDCEAVVSLSAQAFTEDLTLQGVARVSAQFRPPEQLARLAKYHGDKAGWVLDAWADTWLDPGFADWTLDDDLRRVRCPLLALHGTLDEYGSARHPRRITALPQGPTTMRMLPGVAHFPHKERPELVLELVSGWLGMLPVDHRLLASAGTSVESGAAPGSPMPVCGQSVPSP